MSRECNGNNLYKNHINKSSNLFHMNLTDLLSRGFNPVFKQYESNETNLSHFQGENPNKYLKKTNI